MMMMIMILKIMIMVMMTIQMNDNVITMIIKIGMIIGIIMITIIMKY